MLQIMMQRTETLTFKKKSKGWNARSLDSTRWMDGKIPNENACKGLIFGCFDLVVFDIHPICV
jgi:hypothetical protein